MNMFNALNIGWHVPIEANPKLNSVELSVKLNREQSFALEVLKKDDNVFLTGAAGSGKSFLLREYLKDRKIPVLASTGAAAILIGGRTFHSFFGLGIMEGGVQATVDRATENKRLVSRLRKADSVIIDEISMISGPTLRAAEQIAKKARGNTTAWGGLRIIAVGDFAQLPPVNPHSRIREWAFLDEVWEQSQFQTIVLKEIMRSTDKYFLNVLNDVREGRMNDGVSEFLNSRVNSNPPGELTRLFPRRAEVEKYNLEQLNEIKNPLHSIETQYQGKERDIENFRKHSPISDTIHLKVEALIMLRQNDPEGRWVNGSIGRVQKITPDYLTIRLTNGSLVEVEKSVFTLLDAEGQPVVTAQNFPVTLAWAMTIHKAQGATLERMLVNLHGIWEPGQAYVALSRVRNPEGLFIETWNKKSIFADNMVTQFHSEFNKDLSFSE